MTNLRANNNIENNKATNKDFLLKKLTLNRRHQNLQLHRLTKQAESTFLLIFSFNKLNRLHKKLARTLLHHISMANKLLIRVSLGKKDFVFKILFHLYICTINVD